MTEASETQAPLLPLVSVIIVNFNYAGFLRQAIDSVFRQSYPRLECILIDNCSTDDSLDVIENASKAYPAMKIFRQPSNGGQSLASIAGFKESRGEYVIFLDADDFLLPDHVFTHMFVHLSLRLHVGVTSSDMVQIVGDSLVSSCGNNINNHVIAKKLVPSDLLRRIDVAAPALWPLEAMPRRIETDIYLVPQLTLDGFCWSPTSANCYRRDALKLVIDNADLSDLRSCTDAYLLRGISVITGSILIDRPTAVYRFHGTNAFSKHVALNGVMNFDSDSANNPDLRSTQLLIDYFLDNVDMLSRKITPKEYFLAALVAIDKCFDSPSPVAGARTYLAGRLIERFDALRPKLGRRALLWVLIRRRTSWGMVLRMLFR